jgi:hypothetical protein
MWRSEFIVDSKPFEVRIGWLGTERYLFDGKLLEKRRGWAFQSRRQFRVGTHDVLIELAVKQTGVPMGCAYLDGKLHVADLFQAQERKWFRPKAWRIALALLLVLSVVAMARYFKG